MQVKPQGVAFSGQDRFNLQNRSSSLMDGAYYMSPPHIRSAFVMLENTRRKKAKSNRHLCVVV